MIDKKINDLRGRDKIIFFRASIRQGTLDDLQKLKVESRLTWNEFLKDVIVAMEKEYKKKRK